MRRGALAISSALVVFLAGCREEILHDLDESRANQTVVVLERADIAVKKSRSGSLWTISVSRDDALDALAIIERSRMLSRDLFRNKEESKGLLPSREDRRHALERRLAWTLETTLERMPLVLEAKVHLRFEDASSPGGREEKVKSAGVLLVVDEDAPGIAARAQELVAAASGLEAGRISVVLSIAPAAEKPVAPPAPGLSRRMGLGAGFVAVAIALALALVRVRRPELPRRRTPEPLRPISPSTSTEIQ